MAAKLIKTLELCYPMIVQFQKKSIPTPRKVIGNS